MRTKWRKRGPLSRLSERLLVLSLGLSAGCTASRAGDPAANAPSRRAVAGIGGAQDAERAASTATAGPPSPDDVGAAPAGAADVVPGPPEPASDAARAADPFEIGGVPIRGWLSSSFRYRESEDAKDSDLWATLSLDVGDSMQDAVTGHVLMHGNQDLDGQPDDPAEDSVFFDIDNTFGGNFAGRLYDAYVDVHAIDALDEARLGRQLNYETPVLAWFDGLWLETAETKEAGAQLGAYGGAPVRIYGESSDDGLMGGIYGQLRPWDGGRLRLDYMHLSDDLTAVQDADLYSVRGWQSVAHSVSLAAGYTWLESDSRDWFARASWLEPTADLRLQASYYQLLQTQGDLPLEINPFYSSLFDLNPYSLTDLLASKGFGEHFRLEAGASFRRLGEEEDEGVSNRDFDRYYLTGNFLALPGEIDLSLTGETYDASGSALSSWGADLSRAFGPQWSASLGSFFALFEYDQVADEEREQVRTYYVRARYLPTGDLTFDVRAEYQEDDNDEYLVLKLGTTWEF